MNTTWHEKESLFPTAIAALQPVDVVLDIGPGIRPQSYITPLVHICCEPFDQYVDHLKENAKNTKDRVFVIEKMTWQEVIKTFPENSVDTVILSDVIEHLEKEEGRALLEQTKKIARRQIGIFTTLGFVPQHHSDGKDAWGLDGGKWQEHKSGWLPEDFGDHWQVFATKEFHFTDNLGTGREKAEGALWAVYTRTNAEIDAWKNDMRGLWEAAVAVDHRATIRLTTRLLRFAKKIKPWLWQIVRWFRRKKSNS